MLIVGAGPVGLALAVDLGLRGVSCLIIKHGPQDRAHRAPAPRRQGADTREPGVAPARQPAALARAFAERGVRLAILSTADPRALVDRVRGGV
ncbi:MAG TPA: FAD-dependent monooxygenase [Xanthobacteraceae bacterium]